MSPTKEEKQLFLKSAKKECCCCNCCDCCSCICCNIASLIIIIVFVIIGIFFCSHGLWYLSYHQNDDRISQEYKSSFDALKAYNITLLVFYFIELLGAIIGIIGITKINIILMWIPFAYFILLIAIQFILCLVI